MRILLLGEASFVHSTLRKGFRELGHKVVLMSDGNKKRDCPRDVDLRRDMRLGKLGGVAVLLKLLLHLPKLVGNDVVQIQNFQFLPFKVGVNRVVLALLKLCNKRVVKCCLTDDPVVVRRLAEGVLMYSETYVGSTPINVEQNRARVEELLSPEYVSCCAYANRKADALLPCLYEYYVCYDLPQYRDKLHYLPLPMELPSDVELSSAVKNENEPVKVLVGIQSDRDYMKGASLIAALVERVAAENPGKIEVAKVYDVPYAEYLKMLDEADVLVDQLYSYTPSMNSLAAMAHGTVVIGGGEEEFYRFIGEEELRPIINVRPCDDERNLAALRSVLLDRGRVEQMKRQGLEFVRKHHDYLKVSRMYVEVYEKSKKVKK